MQQTRKVYRNSQTFLQQKKETKQESNNAMNQGGMGTSFDPRKDRTLFIPLTTQPIVWRRINTVAAAACIQYSTK